jgi:ketosteroid isomerase-like protein
MAVWSRFELDPYEFIADRNMVVSLGRFKGVHGATGKQADARYAHVWTIRNDKIAGFRQYIDTLAVAEARRA